MPLSLPARDYHVIEIVDCGEPLIDIPATIARCHPHPYQSLGAPYPPGRSPFCLRQGIVERLVQAQAQLETEHPGWQLQIFDGYRPVEVQRFMVEHTFQQLLEQHNLAAETLPSSQQHDLYEQVYALWAPPNENLATPPPHSTGAAVDLTIIDASGLPVEMGSPIDELSERSQPDYFQDRSTELARRSHRHRSLLHQVMATTGFVRHPREWWHFSYGDQAWAWIQSSTAAQQFVAIYGRSD